MPSAQLDLLLVISKGVQTVLANQDSNKAIANSKSINKALANVMDALSTMLRLLGEESEEASWLIQARSRMEPVELCDEEW